MALDQRRFLFFCLPFSPPRRVSHDSIPFQRRLPRVLLLTTVLAIGLAAMLAPKRGGG